MMRSIVQDAWGTELEATLDLHEVDRPAIGDGEVLVHGAAASVNRGTVPA